MDLATMKSRLSKLTGVDDDDLLLVFLERAGNIVVRRRYPRAKTPLPVPEMYESNQLEIAVYLLNKHGAEGQKGHSENGVNRTYESAGVPESMLKDIVPIATIYGSTQEA